MIPRHHVLLQELSFLCISTSRTRLVREPHVRRPRVMQSYCAVQRDGSGGGARFYHVRFKKTLHTEIRVFRMSFFFSALLFFTRYRPALRLLGLETYTYRHLPTTATDGISAVFPHFSIKACKFPQSAHDVALLFLSSLLLFLSISISLPVALVYHLHSNENY